MSSRAQPALAGSQRFPKLGSAGLPQAGWHGFRHASTLAAMTFMVCVETARTFGNFTAAGGYHGSWAGVASVLGLAAVIPMARGSRAGLQCGAILMLIILATILGSTDLPKVKHPGTPFLILASFGLAALLLTHPNADTPFHAPSPEPSDPTERTIRRGFPWVAGLALCGVGFQAILSGYLQGPAAVVVALAAFALAVMVVLRNPIFMLIAGMLGAGTAMACCLMLDSWLSRYVVAGGVWLDDGLGALAGLAVLGWISAALLCEGIRGLQRTLDGTP